MKKFLLSIFCLFSLVSLATAEEVTFVAEGASFSGENVVTMAIGNIPGNTYVSENIELSLTQKNSNVSNVNSGGHVRWYKNDILNVTPKNGVIITNIVFKTTGDSKYCVAFVANKGTATADTSSSTITWNGEADSTLELAADNGQVRFTTMTITYTAGSTESPAVATPTFSVEAGTKYNPFSVEIAAEEGATVYYTLDGTEPTTESAVYSEAIAFNEFGTSTTLKAVAAVDGELSNVASATYSLEVAAPAFSVKGGVYEKLTGDKALQFTCETEGATIYYNNLGGDPITAGSKSWGSLSVLATAEVKAVAYVEVEGKKIYSAVASEKYYISAIKPYEKVTEFAAGQYLIHANGFAATALSETKNYGYLPQHEVAANGNFIETNAFYAFTFTEVEGGYTIQDTFGRYVYMTGTYISFNVAAEMPTEGAVWTVAIDEATGEATITNVAKNKYIQYSSEHQSYGSYDSAQSNAFKPSLYKLGEYPTLKVTPEHYATIPVFDKVTITCESGISINKITDDNYPRYTIGYDNTPYEFDSTVVVNDNTIELTFNKPIEENGNYRVVLPAGLFTLDPDGLAIPNAAAQYTYTVDNPNMLEVAYANPDNGAEVKSIEYLYFEYSQDITDQVEGAVITNEKGEEFPLTVTNTDAWGGQCPTYALCLKTAEPITTPGVYTFVLKKQFVCAEANAAVTIAEDLTYTFTIVEGLKVTNITPANGAEVEVIEDILIEFNKEITCWAEAFYMTSDSGAKYYLTPSFNDKDGNELPYNSIRLVAETPITAAGTYTLYIEDYNIATTDFGMNQEVLPAQTLTFIIPGEGGEGEGEVVVDYTPSYTGTKTYNNSNTTRNITTITLDDNSYDLPADVQSSCYVDATETVTFTVEASDTVKATVAYQGEWIHHAVFIDFDGDGFTSGIEEGSEWKPAGDLVAYSFYNNNDGESDENGYNSIGTPMSGMDRHVPEIPEFAVPTTPGTYRIRFVQDWCSIDPMGDSDGKFGDFMDNGGQIVDVTLVVTEPTGIEKVENVEVKAIYDLTGRKIETITKAGIYIVNGKKVLVK